MKKIFPVLILIAVLVGIGLFILQKKEAPVQIEHILPQQALIYVQVDDVQENFKRLASLPFWQVLSNINYDVLFDKKLIDSRAMDFINLIKNQFSDMTDSPVSNKLFGQEVAFAIYPLNIDMQTAAEHLKTLSPKFMEDVLSGFFMVTRVDSDVQFAEFASRFFSQFGANVSHAQSEYNGQVIHGVTVKEIGITFGFVRLKDLIVIGVGEKAARLSVDVYNGERPALAHDAQFKQVQSRALEPSHVVTFFNFNPVVQLLQDQGINLINAFGLNNEEEDISRQWDQIIDQITGLKTFGFSSQLDPMVRFESYLAFEPALLNPEYAPLYKCLPGENDTIDFVPQNILAYQWSNCFSLDYYWKQIIKELSQNGDPDAKISEIEAQMGVNIVRDLLPTFGDEVGGFIQDIQVSGFFPIPKMLLFIKIKDRTKADQLLGLLNAQPITMLQEESYGGESIKYLSLPLGEDVQPSYVFLDQYFLLSTSRLLIKNSIDAKQDSSKSLVASLEFKEVDYGLTDDNRMVQFIKIGQIVEKIKGLLEWSDQWFTAQDEKAQAFKTGTSKPLEEVKANIESLESEVKLVQDNIISLEDEIWNLESKGEDTSAQQTEMVSLKEQASMFENQLIAEQERMEGLSDVVEDFDQGAIDPQLRRTYIDEIIYPLLESLKSVAAIGVRSTIENNVFESSVIMNMGQ